MNKHPKLARWQLIALVAILLAVVTGCTNVRQGVSWPGLDVVTVNGEKRILVAYENRIELLNPQVGTVARLTDADGDIVADANGEARLWVINGSDFNNAQFFVPPFRSNAQDGDTFVFPTYNNRFLEFYLSDLEPVNTAGTPLTDGVLAEVILSEDFIYVPYRQQDLVALDRTTREEVWRFDTVEGVWSTPLLHDGVLYFGSVDHMLYAVDAETGEAVWSEPVDLDGAIASTPLLHNDHLYVGGYSHVLNKISLDGEIVASYEGANWIWDTPLLVDDTLYYTDLNGFVYALDADTLEERWAVRPSQRGFRAGPILTDEGLLVASRGGMLYWIDPDNGLVELEVEFDGTPEILSDVLLIEANEELNTPALVIVGTADAGRLVAAFNVETGRQEWVYSR